MSLCVARVRALVAYLLKCSHKTPYSTVALVLPTVVTVVFVVML